MVDQLTDERVLYRCHRTVNEMLKDRGYNIGDAALEESYEEFTERLRPTGYKNRHIIAYRPGRQHATEVDENGEPAMMKEPIFVCFAEEEKLGQEAFKGLLEYMDRWSKGETDKLVMNMLNAILVVKGSSTQVFKKVSL